MLYSMNDPIEGDDDGDEGADLAGGNDHDGDETVSEQRTITRHKGSGKFLKNVANAPKNPMKGKPTGKASGSGKKLVKGKKQAPTGKVGGGKQRLILD